MWHMRGWRWLLTPLSEGLPRLIGRQCSVLYAAYPAAYRYTHAAIAVIGC